MTVPMAIRTLQPPPQAVLCHESPFVTITVFPKSPNKPFYQIGREFAPLSPLRWFLLIAEAFLSNFRGPTACYLRGVTYRKAERYRHGDFRSRRVLLYL
jgi:hypothetical protein